MESDLHRKEIESALDHAHAKAQSAFNAKDLDCYMAGFSRNLSYKQFDGLIINWERLRKDVASQFARFSKVESKFIRERIEYEGSNVVEYVSQNATAEERVFVVFKRLWRIRRRGIYTWSKVDSGWVISKVDVLEEIVR